MFFTGLLWAKPPIDLQELDHTAYAEPTKSLSQIQQKQSATAEEITTLWLQVIEAKALYHLNRFSESQSILINVESATEEMVAPDIKEMTHRLMGQNYYRMGGFDQAMNNALKARLIAEENGLDWELAQITNMLAAIHLRSGEFNQALNYFLTALKYFESVDSKEDVAKVKNNLAALYIETQEYDLASEYLDDALSLAVELKRATTTISALVNQVELHVNTHDFNSAINAYNTCLAHAAEENLPRFEVWCLEVGAEMYQSKGDFLYAIELANRAYAMAGLQNLHQSKINLGKILVHLYTENDQFEEALKVSSQNLTQVEEIKDEVLQLKLDEVKALNEVEQTRSQLQFERQQNKLHLNNQRLTWAGLTILLSTLMITLLLLRSKQRLVLALNTQQDETADALEEMRKAKEDNEKLAKTDPLTGMFNRREITRILETTCIQNQLHSDMTVMMIDVDRFKNINDQYGHASGDLVLVELAQIIQRMMPSAASCARWGGEEFLVILPAHNCQQARLVAEKLTDEVAHKILDSQQNISVTVSIGLSQYKTSLNADDWIHQADQALYTSKNNGRNQVSVF